MAVNEIMALILLSTICLCILCGVGAAVYKYLKS